MKFWLTRDEGSEKSSNIYAILGGAKPKKTSGVFAIDYEAEKTLYVCADMLEEITGIKLKPGEIREIQSITIKLNGVKDANKRRTRKAIRRTV